MSLAAEHASLDQSCQAALPRYRCHKEVWALKIAAVEEHKPTIQELERLLAEQSQEGDGIGGFLKPEDPMFGVIAVSTEYMLKHQPQPGGYYVVYLDGYKSFSPAEAFEGGYTRI